MNSDEAHSWQFEVAAGDVITIGVAGPQDKDLTLEILDPSGNRVVQQNNGPAGEVEIVNALTVDDDGSYRVLIREAGHAESDYAMLLLNSSDDDYYQFIFAGILGYGDSETVNLAEETDHFWFFFGIEGERVDVTITPNDNANMFFDLYGRTGNLLEQEINNGVSGDPEELLDYPLPATGIYSIRAGEWQYAVANYTITLARN